MWSKRSFLLKIRVKVRGGDTRFGFWLLISLLPLHHLLLACDTITSLLYGAAEAARMVADTVHGVLLAILAVEPQEYAHIEVQDKKMQNVYVDIRTLGFGLEGGGFRFTRGAACPVRRIPYGCAFFARFFACLMALLLAAALFPEACLVSGAIWGSMLLTVFYALLRPLMQAVILPFNIFLCGLLTPITDALLVLWASAWGTGLSFTYWQSVAVALLVSALYLPFSYWKQRSLLGAVLA